jgi:hypothetical protein
MVTELLTSIRLNNVSSFGIVKLSQYVLDDVISIDNHFRSETLDYGNLLYRAMRNNSAAIVAALLRSGADPTVLYFNTNIVSVEGGCEFILSISQPYAIWIVQKVEIMLHDVITKSISNTDDHLNCTISCMHCSNTEDVPIITYPNCNHNICWICLWNHIINSCREKFNCPCCNIRIDGGSDEISIYNMCLCEPLSNIDTNIEYDTSSNNNNINSSNSHIVDFCPLSDVNISHLRLKLRCNVNERNDDSSNDYVHISDMCVKNKKLSLQYYNKLPDDYNDPTYIHTHKQHLVPLPFHQAVSLYIGPTKHHRNVEYHKATLTNNFYRLLAIICSGVDVDCTNEYGQTALHVAVFYGHFRIIQLLLWAGISTNTLDNCKYTAFDYCVSDSMSTMLSRAFENTLKIEYSQPTSTNALYSIDDMKLNELSLNTIDPIVTILLQDSVTYRDHPGLGSCYIDNCFPESFLSYLDHLFQVCPIAPPEKKSCSDRYYIFDSLRIIQQHITAAILNSRRCVDSDGDTNSNIHSSAIYQVSKPLPHMRFLSYVTPGGSLAPHIDLSRTDPITNVTSTHTFILYLSDCASGGETILLDTVKPNYTDLAVTCPKRGRLLLFPHVCPHRGALVTDVPKLLLRGEIVI